MKQAFVREKIPFDCLDTMVSSLSSSSIKQYDTHIRKWWSYCQRQKLELFTNAINMVIAFLQEMLNNGASYGSLNSARSALSLILPRSGGTTVGENPSVKRFLRGAFKLRPTKRKYSMTWNPTPVLNYLGSLMPNESLPLKDMTLKLVGLLSLATAQRLQTLCAIKLPNIKVDSKGVSIIITDVLKTTKPGNPNPVLSLPFLSCKPELCVASLLVCYIKRTETLRTNDSQNALISYAKPFSAVSTQTLSRWLKTVLKQGGIDTSVFTAHSTRHASTSAAARNGCSVEQIRGAAGWTASSSVFEKHYHRPLIENTSFAESVLTI